MGNENVYMVVDLICKSWQDALSSAEENELNQLLEDPKWLQLKVHLENDQFVMDRFRKYKKYDAEADFSAFLAAVKKRGKIKSKKNRWYWVGVASIILGVFFGVLVYLLDSTVEKEKMKTRTMLAEAVNQNGIRLIISEEQMINISEGVEAEVLDSIGVCLTKHSKTLNYLNVSKVETGNFMLRYHTLLVPKGEIYKLILSDSTKVVLNAETKIKYPVCFEKDKREINIEGEAYLEVAKNPNAPFIVAGKNYKLEVLGTSFNVRSYDDEFMTDITLLTGSIKMDLQDSSFFLSPGEQVSISREDGYEVHRVDVSSSVSWLENKFSFDNEQLEVIMRKVARWYGIEVVYEEPALRKRRYTGKVPNDVPLEELLEMLNHTTNIKYSAREGVVFVNCNKE